MEAQIAQFTNRGMYQDTSISKANNEFAFYNYNIRITPINDNTLLSISNEILPKKCALSKPLEGIYVGHTILNDYLIIFTKSSNNDRIYRIEIKDTIDVVTLFEGDLSLYSDNIQSIETLSYYESETIQKIYWVDGVHQPRFINIVSDKIPFNNANQVNFTPSVVSFPNCNIKKNYNSLGIFPSGVIQYFASYYNKHGVETGIVWASDLQYITEYNKGESPDNTVNCTFTLEFENLDTNFEYIKIYSLYRTSYNGEVVAQIVADKKLNSTLIITDTNNNEVIDPTSLFFLGGSNFIASTIAQKDNTLFLGNITAKNEIIPESITTLINDKLIPNNEGIYISPYISFETKTIGKTSEEISEEFQLNNSEKNIKTFKYGELYRFGIQFQTSTSIWTVPIWIGDAICDVRPEIIDDNIYVANAVVRFTDDLKSEFEKYYINYRLLIAEPTNADRTILAQGIVSPTVFNFNERVHGDGAYAISSWLMRPRKGKAAYEHLTSVGNKVSADNDIVIFENLETCEIQNAINKAPVISSTEYQLGFIVSFNYSYNKLYYNVFFGKNTNGTVNIDPSTDVKKHIASGSFDIEVFNPDIYTSAIPTFEKAIEEIKIKIAEEVKYPLQLNIGIASQLANYFVNIFAEDPKNESLNYKNVYRLMPDGKYSSGYFYLSGNTILKRYNDEDEFGCYTYIVSNYVSTDIEGFKSNYYIDNSILTFHSPEIENNEVLFTDSELTFDIVGIVSVDKVKSNINLQFESPTLNENARLLKTSLITNQPLINDVLFEDGKASLKDNEEIEISKSIAKYYLYLWNKSNSLVGQTANWLREEKYSYLKNKTIANKNFSLHTNYIDWNILNSDWNSINVKPVVFNSDQVITKIINVGNDTKYYQGNYETLLNNEVEDIKKEIYTYRVFWKENRFLSDFYLDQPQYDPVSIKYKSTPHLVFSLGNNILPYLPNNNENKWKDSFSDFYNIDNGKLAEVSLPWLTENEGLFIHSYNQASINDISTNELPYFYLAELKKPLDYNTIYGGTDHNAIERLNWIIASDTYKITEVINKSYGDTYYQRWDCLKTYPFTREDKNSVIDITSFMVETHINLLGRYDKHKELDDILNVDISNFNKINSVYSQPNNFFSYKVLDEKYQNTTHSTQIVYSLNKIPTSDVDLWTSVTLNTAFNLDGTKGNLNKIINLNDTLIAFQDKAISSINFNNRTALSTESGIPIEIANSGKVDGYSIIIDNVGCQNKQSICITSSGVYFIDDRNKTLFNFNKEGLSNISSKGFIVWFKNNLTGKEKIHYDSLNHDLYITNENTCLNYNEDLQSFVSFFDYKNIDTLFNLNNHTYQLKDSILKEMFKGDYAYNYSIQHKINPEPLADKVFTNIEYIADCYEKSVDSSKSFGNSADKIPPFNKLKVWNEYQEGETTNLNKRYPNFNKKFRLWRVDVPRDKHSLRDRIRNPWMMLELSNDKEHNNRMVFHNLLVKYYK